MSGQPGLPSRLGRPRAEERDQFRLNRFGRPSSISSSEKVLNAAKLASDSTTTRGFNDLSWVVEFFRKKVTPDVRKPGKVCLSANVLFLQVSTYKVIEDLYPYGFSLTKDHRIGVSQSFVRQSRYMESAQYHLGPFRSQTIGNMVNIRHVVGQADD
jgi:hypothetical protein